MKWLICAFGKPALGFAKAGIAEYISRMERYAPVETRYLKESATAAENTKRQLEATAGTFRIVLDERGEIWDTLKFATTAGDWADRGTKKVSVLLGAASGHEHAVRNQADLMLALSRFTLQHELALLLFTEQLYRAYTVIRGEPYHK